MYIYIYICTCTHAVYIRPGIMVWSELRRSSGNVYAAKVLVSPKKTKDIHTIETGSLKLVAEAASCNFTTYLVKPTLIA